MELENRCFDYRKAKKNFNKPILNDKDKRELSFLLSFLYLGYSKGVCLRNIPLDRIAFITSSKIHISDWGFRHYPSFYEQHIGGCFADPIIYTFHKIKTGTSERDYSFHFCIGFHVIDLVKAFMEFEPRGAEWKEKPQVGYVDYLQCVRLLYPIWAKNLDDKGIKYDKKVFFPRQNRFSFTKREVEDEFLEVICYYMHKISGKFYSATKVKKAIKKDMSWTKYFNQIENYDYE